MTDTLPLTSNDLTLLRMKNVIKKYLANNLRQKYINRMFVRWNLLDSGTKTCLFMSIFFTDDNDNIIQNSIIKKAFHPVQEIPINDLIRLRKKIEDKVDLLNQPLEHLLEAQNIIDKYKEAMIDSDYLGLCGQLKHISSH